MGISNLLFIGSKWMEGQLFPDMWKVQQNIIFSKKLKPIGTSENWD